MLHHCFILLLVLGSFTNGFSQRRNNIPPPPPPPPPPPTFTDDVEFYDEEFIEEEEPEEVDYNFEVVPEPEPEEIVDHYSLDSSEMPLLPYDKALCDDLPQRCSDAMLATLIEEHKEYPLSASQFGIEGLVVVGYVIDKEGKMKDIQIMRNPGGGLGEEATRIVTLLSEKLIWIPGENEGEIVSVRRYIPIRFILEE